MSQAGPHDVGGRAGDRPVERDQHAFAPWEVRVDAIMLALTDAARPGGRLMTVDELRRGVEALPPEDYERLSYYQRWLRSLIAIMVEHGAIDAQQLERRYEALVAEHERAHAAGEHH